MKSQHWPGFLIVIEGIDGAGKTTQADRVQAALSARGFTVVRTKEPTNGRWGKVLRDSAITGRLSLEEEAETFIKDRREHVETLLLPELRAGRVVLMDRYYFSTAAYQGARGLDPQVLLARNEEFAPEPDLLVLLDVEPQQGLERVRTRGDQADHFEVPDALRRAREIFNRIDQPYLCKLDARQTPEALTAAIVGEFTRRHAAARPTP